MPRRSASSTIASAIRSFTLPAGLSDSILPRIVAPPGWGTRLSRTIGVAPTRSSTDAAMRGRPLCPARSPVMARNPIGNRESRPRKKAGGSDVVHRPRGAAPLLRATAQVLDRHSIDDGGHGLIDLAP